jgi:hypothetical protein
VQVKPIRKILQVKLISVLPALKSLDEGDGEEGARKKERVRRKAGRGVIGMRWIKWTMSFMHLPWLTIDEEEVKSGDGRNETGTDWQKK